MAIKTPHPSKKVSSVPFAWKISPRQGTKLKTILSPGDITADGRLEKSKDPTRSASKGK
jgi:hypothetical protein